MFPACRTESEGFTIPTFDLVPRDVEGFIDELWEFQAAFHDCFTRSEPRVSVQLVKTRIMPPLEIPFWGQE
jgi:hypothetical protein